MDAHVAGDLFTYDAFALCIAASEPLAGLTPAREPDGVPDVTIRREPIDPATLPERNNDGSVIAGRAEGTLRFVVEQGRQLLYDPLPEADPEFVQALLTGELLAVLLRQRGLLVLHASCVARDGEAVGFVGFSGWGKSTLATYFSEQGYMLLTDDVLAVDLDGEEPTVQAGHPRVKLRPDAAARFMQGRERLSALQDHSDKFLYASTAFHGGQRAALRRLYLLEGWGRDETRMRPLSASEAFPEMLRHTRGTQLIKDAAWTTRHLEQCAALLRQVPVRCLEREHSLDRLPMIHRMIERDMAGHPVLDPEVNE